MADITGILKALNDATNTITGATTIKVLGGAVTILKEALMNLTNIVQEQSELDDENGVISIKVKSNDSNKKLSSIHETATSPVKTFQVTELYELAPELPQ